MLVSVIGRRRVVFTVCALSAVVVSTTHCKAPQVAPPAKPDSIIEDTESVEVDVTELGFDHKAVREVTATSKKIRVTFGAEILFETGKSEIKPEAFPALKAVMKVAARDRGRLHIEGHTDDVGDTDYNLKLSRRRAASVSSWLERGIEKDRVAITGYGEHWPRVPNTSKKNRALNRRVEIVFHGIGGAGVSLDEIGGHWAGDWGHLVLRRSGDRVLGTYNHDQGTLVGRWRNGRLFAWWSESPSREPTKDAGECEFRFRRTKQKVVLDGRWRYGAKGAWKEDWNLERVHDPPDAALLKRFEQGSLFREHPGRK